MSHTPKLVSVILTADGGNLTTVLRSALRQTHNNLELLFAADVETWAKVAAEADDKRVSLVPVSEAASPAEARNAALACARGQTVAYLTADCAWYPYHLECLLEAMADAGDIQAAASRLYHVRRRGDLPLEKKLPPVWSSLRESLLNTPCVELVSLCHRRELLEKTGTFDCELPTVLADWDFARRLAFYTDFAAIEDVTGELTAPGRSADDEQFRRTAELVRAKRPPKPWSGIEEISTVSALPQADLPAHGLELGRRLEAEGNWRQAAQLYQQLHAVASATADLEHLAAYALYRGGDTQQSLELCRKVNDRRPTVDSLLLEARLHRGGDDDESALEALQHAEQILSWKG